VQNGANILACHIAKSFNIFTFHLIRNYEWAGIQEQLHKENEGMRITIRVSCYHFVSSVCVAHTSFLHERHVLAQLSLGRK
jgi:hypothetical protein